MAVRACRAFCFFSASSNLFSSSFGAFHQLSIDGSLGRVTYLFLVFDQIPRPDRLEREVEDVEHEDVVLVELGLVGAGSERQDELEVCELAELDNEARLDGQLPAGRFMAYLEVGELFFLSYSRALGDSIANSEEVPDNVQTKRDDLLVLLVPTVSIDTYKWRVTAHLRGLAREGRSKARIQRSGPVVWSSIAYDSVIPREDGLRVGHRLTLYST